MAGTITVTRNKIYGDDKKNVIEKVTATCVADSADGSFPVAQIPLHGEILRIVTNPGATAPTDNWDFILGDPDDNALDVIVAAGANRDTATTEQIKPLINSNVLKISGVHALTITGNSVNSANIEIHFYMQVG